MANRFIWNYVEGMGCEDNNPFFTRQITFDREIVCKDSYDLCLPILKNLQDKVGIKIKTLLRSRINLIFQYNVTDEEIIKSLHKDFPYVNRDNLYSLVYYVNDSDGDNLIYDDTKSKIVDRCSPKSGNAYLFESNLWHTALPPVKSRRRLTVVFIFETY